MVARPCFETRFWDKVDKVDNTQECWNWKGATTNAGYGKIFANKKLELAHRMSWRMNFGDIPEGMHVLHSCDNASCVRPDHLFLGSHQDNMDDMHSKGREARGQRHGRYTHPESILRGEDNGIAKLTEEEVAAIRQRYATGTISQASLGREYGVCQQQICRIIQGIRWKHLDN